MKLWSLAHYPQRKSASELNQSIIAWPKFRYANHGARMVSLGTFMPRQIPDLSARWYLITDKSVESATGSQEAAEEGAHTSRMLTGTCTLQYGNSGRISLSIRESSSSRTARMRDRFRAHQKGRLFSQLEPLDTTAAQDLLVQMESLIKEYWPINGMPDVVLISIYLNPACPALGIFDNMQVEDGTLLRDKAIKLTISALEASKLEKSRRDEPSTQLPNARQLSFTIRRVVDPFHLEAVGAVASYTATTTVSPGDFVKYKDKPQEFWDELQHHHHFKDLAVMARSYLCIQATSTESERLFSRAGQLQTPRRTQLSDHIISNILFANSFYMVKKLALEC
ncbi:hypothetical protein BGZ94_006568 [Podila epigama]|nr:hypothetical protein BGZ94_006568 [Podila epigama]